MQILSFSRALKWAVCPRCLSILHDNGRDDALCESEADTLQYIRGIYDNFIIFHSSNLRQLKTIANLIIIDAGDQCRAIGPCALARAARVCSLSRDLPS